MASDESFVVVYDEQASPPARVRDAVRAGEEDSLDRASLLVQRVEVSGRP